MDVREAHSSSFHHPNEVAFAIHEPPVQFLVLTHRNLQIILKYRPPDELANRLLSGDIKSLEVSLVVDYIALSFLFHFRAFGMRTERKNFVLCV